MNRNIRKSPGDGSDGSPPSEAWLFAQAILGNPIPSPDSIDMAGQTKREHLEWLATISPRHEAELRKLLGEEAERRRQREQLEWLATMGIFKLALST